jgi:RNA polymerase sigma-70 factor, ECF subfamily
MSLARRRARWQWTGESGPPRLLCCDWPMILPPRLDAETDAQLVRRIGAREEAVSVRDVEAELCRRFVPRIRLYGLRHLRSPDRARDLVQAVLVALLQALRQRRIKEAEHIDRFVLGTCRNVAARMRDADGHAVSTDPADLELAGPMPSLEHLDFEALFRCIARLDERARAVVRLCFQEDRSAQEIGPALGTTAGNVRVLRHRAIAQLRSCLDHHDGGAAA